MHFDGSINKDRVGADVWIISPNRYFMVYTFKLTFECMNNVGEYEDFILGLNVLKDLKENRIDVYGYFELVVNQVNGIYQTKHPSMRAYINEVWDMLGNFFNEHRVMVIPRIQNKITDSLDFAAGAFKILIYPNIKYENEVVNRQVFEDDL